TNYYRLMDKFADEAKQAIDGIATTVSNAVASGTSPGSFSTVTTAEAEIRHAAKIWTFDASTLQIVGTANPTLGLTGGWRGSGTSSMDLIGGPAIPVGETVTTVNLYVVGDTVQTISLKVWNKNLSTGSTSQLGTTQTSALTSTNQTLTASGLSFTI